MKEKWIYLSVSWHLARYFIHTGAFAQQCQFTYKAAGTAPITVFSVSACSLLQALILTLSGGGGVEFNFQVDSVLKLSSGVVCHFTLQQPYKNVKRSTFTPKADLDILDWLEWNSIQDIFPYHELYTLKIIYSQCNLSTWNVYLQSIILLFVQCLAWLITWAHTQW